MIKDNFHRNFEWFEASFTKEIQYIFNEYNQNNVSWVRDLFISILLTIIPLACELMLSLRTDISSENGIVVSTEFVYKLCIYIAYASIAGLIGWIVFCIWKYNKVIQKMKMRIIPHTIKNRYSYNESIYYFDNDVCNNIILSKNYIALSLNETEISSKEFYLIEAIHYYYKSIYIFNIICFSRNSSELQRLFSSGNIETAKHIDTMRLINYLSLIKSIKIPFDSSNNFSMYDNIYKYNSSFELIVSTFNSAYCKLQEQLPIIEQFAKNNNNNNIIRIIEDIEKFYS